jgi:hypothetical protein
LASWQQIKQNNMQFFNEVVRPKESFEDTKVVRGTTGEKHLFPNTFLTENKTIFSEWGQ